MNAREERGLVIAALCKLNRTPDGWLVPSQSGKTIYRVNVERQTCSCPDHTEGGFKCKHLYAVEFTIKREVAADGTVTDTKTLTFTEKVKYKQDWPAYNDAQSIEKDRLQELLADLCGGVAEPEHKGRGRKPHPIQDALFTVAFQVYTTLSSRRFSSDLREAHNRGYISTPIPGLKTPQFFEDPALTPVLKTLIGLSSLPLRSVETKFAIDSSGFGRAGLSVVRSQVRRHAPAVRVDQGSRRQRRPNEHRYGRPHSGQGRPRLAAIHAAGQGNREELHGREVIADKAYASLENFETVAECGGTAYIPFKAGTTGAVGGLFQKMFHYFQFKQEEYMKHYHLRSNVESTFSAVKRKFGDSLRSRTDTAMTNEVLCKFLCHNLCVLIQEEQELGIDPIFWPEAGKPALEVFRPA